MLTAILIPISLLGMLVGLNNAQDSQCDHHQQLEPGKPYYIFNPNYPDTYTGRNSCRWIVQSNYPMKLTCDELALPRSQDCSEDELSIKANDNSTHNYCGNSTINIESEDNLLEIRFHSQNTTTGGRFFCIVETIEEKQKNPDCDCGITSSNRIVGGEETNMNEYSMVAALVDASNKSVFCTGAIIANLYILIAAHCVSNRNLAEMAIIVGEREISTGFEANDSNFYGVAEAIVYPKYNNKTLQNDIAILRVDRDIKFSHDVGAVCLPFRHSSGTFPGTRLDVLDWNETKSGGQITAVLEKTTVRVLSNFECGRPLSIDNLFSFCTFSTDVNSCQSDQNGPLIFKDPATGQPFVTGIISRGMYCSISSPAINARVIALLDWIVFATPDFNFCRY
ncbi:venom serine protease 34-like [Prorops nasuta]|uniref:venom serine protease 34-like n=1 Tax=Prorops nasuta TaxID=863751 RepID=UPI0034CF5B39